MASIVKRKSKYSVVYDYTDENGKRRQRWETFSTNAEAKKRKKQIEYEQDSGTFFIPTAKTLNDLLDEYMSIYGVNTWAMSTYESRRGLARNYITPIIGDMLLSDITPRMMDKYYRDLLSVKTVSVNNRKPTSEYLTPHTVREIHKLLRSAFNQAVRWELISRNPVLNATLPKEEHKERDIWTAETLSKAMEVCDDPILSLALNLAFSCSLRIGEMLGLTWDCIDIAPQSIENGSAYIFVNKELQRVTRGALDDLSDKGVIKKFPPCIASTHTALVLKEPKTKTSIRRVYLPKTVAYMLVERKKEIDELMDLFGDEYIDNNLVFCSSNGRPMESQVINRAFNKLIKENGLPHVVFHSLRHSSIVSSQILNVSTIDAACFVRSLCVLVQVVGADSQERNQGFHILQIQSDTVTIQSHFPQIGSHAADAKLVHLLMDSLDLLLGCKEMNILISLCHYNTSSRVSEYFAGGICSALDFRSANTEGRSDSLLSSRFSTESSIFRAASSSASR